MTYPTPQLPRAPVPGHVIRPHVSVSQIEQFGVDGTASENSATAGGTGCQRKWAYKYLWGLKQPPTKSTQTGKGVHSQVENYLNGGQLDLSHPYGKIALPLLTWLPDLRGLDADKPEHPINISEETQRRYFGRFIAPWVGFRDWSYRQHYLGSNGDPTKASHYQIDFKTTKDFKWAKTKESLESDTQKNVYAFEYCVTRGVELINSQWITTLTEGVPDAIQTLNFSSLDETLPYLVQINNSAENITQLKAQYQGAPFDPDTLPANPKACYAYGGCPYRSICGKGHINPTNRKLGDLIMSQGQFPGVAPGQPANLADMLRLTQTAPAAQPAQPGYPAGYVPPGAPQAQQPPAQPQFAPQAQPAPLAAPPPAMPSAVLPPEAYQQPPQPPAQPQFTAPPVAQQQPPVPPQQTWPAAPQEQPAPVAQQPQQAPPGWPPAQQPVNPLPQAQAATQLAPPAQPPAAEVPKPRGRPRKEGSTTVHNNGTETDTAQLSLDAINAFTQGAAGVLLQQGATPEQIAALAVRYLRAVNAELSAS